MLIIDAAKDYYEDNKNDFKKVDEVSYCISVSDLVKYNYLNSKLKDKDLNDVNISKQVKMNYINNSFKYEIVDACNYYTVTFDTDGGDIDIGSKQVLENSLYGELPVPTKEGYTFMGWNGKNMFELKDVADAVYHETFYEINTVNNFIKLYGNMDESYTLIEFYLPTLMANKTYTISSNIELNNCSSTQVNIVDERQKYYNINYILHGGSYKNDFFSWTFKIGSVDELTAALILYGTIGIVNAETECRLLY